MSWTKRQVVVQAYEEIGYASYEYDLEPEQLQSALRRLDAMVATWNGRGINIGYILPDSPENSELATETEVPDWAAEALYLNLAIRLAPIVGKGLSIETKALAKAAYMEVLRQSAQPIKMQSIPTLPLGAGHKARQDDNRFVQKEDDRILIPPVNEVAFDG